MASIKFRSITARLTTSMLAVFLSVLATAGQNDTNAALAGWIRVHSENGEFSIEVPSDYAYFADDPGHFISHGGADIPLFKMRNLNAVMSGTFVGFEVYQAGKTALDQIYAGDKAQSNTTKASKIKQNGFEIRQIDFKSDKATWTRKLFRSKTHIYILTAGSREASSSIASHFFNSLRFEPGSNSQSGKGISFSSLNISAPAVEAADPNAQPATSAKPQSPDPNRLSPLIFSKPQASYVETARSKGIRGVVRLKVTLGKDGAIPKVVVVRGLPDGLTRQAIFAAFRLKFLPTLDNGEPVDSTVTIEYSFSIF